MKLNKNIFNSKIMTEVKFGYGYPGNVILGGVYTLICSILLVLTYKKLL